MSEILLEVKGHNGALFVYHDRIAIIRKGSFLAKASGLYDKEITIKSLTAIQLKEPGMFTNGFISFSFSGGKESKGGVFDATKDENSIMITKKQLNDFKKAKDIIYDLMKKASSESKVQESSPDPIEMLEKLADLKEKGIISDEEFSAKKKQILNI
ncbi:SHOCT domain-containing protein [Brevibacillus agri]|uniref:SHOCT domain-containing protein n=1 Tax=Brevibacillus agri TaxID=51101 RepID=UPI002E22345E|nr:SHOCT domain-containing protein [Brevibacillus agri]MED1652612.1 SHOCT domain-containing protein [Brevibacillus agri]MED1689634.1 SHOCT domain-containing protein [Brevibacillus agri]MED1691128.1 SHOCT domain-containing protein [Brevibacillus agri]MED1696762.1 SHOCT domain-containing protein [Brevibacillus agri]